MVLDSAKGIETQTRKLFEVCRQRNMPILTFINKMDHEGREPLELLDEIEQMLSLRVSPMNWPIGTGSNFQGVYDLQNHQVLLFERTVRGKFRAPVQVTDLYDPLLEENHWFASLSTASFRMPSCCRVQAHLLTKLISSTATLTPVFFGSALNNFGGRAVS